MRPISPPASITELLARAYALADCTFQELAHILGYKIKGDSIHTKGSLGQLLELALGAESKSLPQPDFPHLGIELKTIPVSAHGLPQESTYICTVPIPNPEREWRESRVYKKMAHILWIPYLDTPLIHDRRIGTPFLWSMCPTIEAVLKQDWEELTEYIHLGQVERLSAHLGTYLQIRPKAADASNSLIPVLNHDGDTQLIVPKGFYLRSCVTKLILENYILENYI